MMEWKNNNVDGESLVQYSFEHYFGELDYVLLKVSFYEGGKYIMVNRKNGGTFDMPGTPIISPDKTKLVSAFRETYAYPGYIGIEFFKILKTGLESEGSLKTEPVYGGVSAVTWLDSNTVLLESVESNKKITFRIIHNSSGWQLMTAEQKRD